MDQSLIFATWVQAVATIGLVLATAGLCVVTRSLYSATNNLARVTLEPLVEVIAPPDAVPEKDALFKITNLGALELLCTRVMFGAVVEIEDTTTPFTEKVIEQLGSREIGSLRANGTEIVPYWEHAQTVLRVPSVREGLIPFLKNKPAFYRLVKAQEEGRQISCKLHCAVVGQHPVSKTIYVYEKAYKVNSTADANIKLCEVAEKTPQPAYKLMSGSFLGTGSAVSQHTQEGVS